MKITTMIKTAVAVLSVTVMTTIAFASARIQSAVACPITGKLGNEINDDRLRWPSYPSAGKSAISNPAPTAFRAIRWPASSGKPPQP